MLDFQAIEAALRPIADLGKSELSFDVDGVPLTLRVLTPEENFACQKFARTDGDKTEFPVFIENYKRMLLGYAIVKIGAIDLHGVKYVPSGEVTPEGKPVQIEKHVAVRKVIEKQEWSGTTLQFVFTKYGDLQRAADIDAEQRVNFFPPDLDAEIDRLDNRLKELRAEKDRLTNNPTPMSAVVDVVQKASALTAEQDRRRLQGETETFTSREELEEEAEPTPEPYIPPPVQAAPQAPPPRRERIMPPPQVAPPVRLERPHATQDQLPDVMDSFSDTSDSALAAEETRIAQARAAAARLAAQVDAQDNEVLETIAPPTGRRAPHLEAAATAGGLQNATLDGVIGDMPAYRLPAEVLSGRGKQPGTSTKDQSKPLVNKTGGGWTNPRFKKP